MARPRFPLLCLLGALASGAATFAASAQAFALTNVTLVDATAPAPRPGMTVLVREGRITAVGPVAQVAIPAGAHVVDGGGRFLIPGLWDMHVHLSKGGEVTLPVFVATGVTGVRDMGGDFAEVGRWRHEVAAGRRLGPRIRAAGPMLESAAYVERRLRSRTVEPVARMRAAVAGPADAARVVDSLAALGVDFI